MGNLNWINFVGMFGSLVGAFGKGWNFFFEFLSKSTAYEVVRKVEIEVREFQRALLF